MQRFLFSALYDASGLWSVAVIIANDRDVLDALLLSSAAAVISGGAALIHQTSPPSNIKGKVMSRMANLLIGFSVQQSHRRKQVSKHS